MTMNIIHLKFIIAALALSLLLQRTVTAFIRTTNFFFAYDISFLLLEYCTQIYTRYCFQREKFNFAVLNA